MFINLRLRELDTLTFLYIRNGEKVYRMNCDLDFGHNLFPDRAMFHRDQRTMFYSANVQGGKNENIRMISRSEYEARIENRIRNRVVQQTWVDLHGASGISYMEEGRKSNIVMDGIFVRYRIRTWSDPYRNLEKGSMDQWEPFDKSTVYYDDACGCVEKQMKLYNRVVLIIQGLFDRSEVLHPHPQVKMWTEEGFNSAIKLIYDGDMVIEYGNPPSFEQYWKECNAKTDKNSAMIGQEDCWERLEAKKENDRISRNWRERRDRDHIHFRPYGNDGPGYVAHMKNFSPRSGKCTFTWMRDRLTGRYYGEPIKAQVAVPLDKLFNASAYTPGDYKKFFNDPRTRRDYLKWAPLLIAAEEYHAGHKRTRAQRPV